MYGMDSLVRELIRVVDFLRLTFFALGPAGALASGPGSGVCLRAQSARGVAVKMHVAARPFQVQRRETGLPIEGCEGRSGATSQCCRRLAQRLRAPHGPQPGSR